MTLDISLDAIETEPMFFAVRCPVCAGMFPALDASATFCSDRCEGIGTHE